MKLHELEDQLDWAENNPVNVYEWDRCRQRYACWRDIENHPRPINGKWPIERPILVVELLVCIVALGVAMWLP